MQSINLLPYKIKIDRLNKKRKMRNILILTLLIIFIFLTFYIPYAVLEYYRFQDSKEKRIYNCFNKKYENSDVFELDKKSQFIKMVKEIKASNKYLSSKIDIIKKIIPDDCVIQSIEFNKNTVNLILKSSKYTETGEIIKKSKDIKSIKNINYGIIKFVNDGYVYDIEILLEEKEI